MRRLTWDPTPTFIFEDEADLARQYERYAAELDEWDPQWFMTDRRMDTQLAKLAQQRRDAAERRNA